jgi:hypothetical protein
LLGDRTHGFHTDVDGDAFTSGYVEIDDLRAGDDLGFQMLLVDFLTERAATRRIWRLFTTVPGSRSAGESQSANARLPGRASVSVTAGQCVHRARGDARTR